MKLTACILLILGLTRIDGLAQTNAAASAAGDYFNLGSATFIRENPESALGIVNEGLSIYPGDESLLRLKKLLEEKQNEQQEQQDQEQEQQPDPQDGQSGEPENQSPEQEQESEEPQDQKNKDGDEEQPEEKEEPQPADMTKNEAEMMLDSLRQLEQAQREQLMQEMIRNKIPDMPPVEKDW